jgi:predicted phage tail protein
MAFRLTGLAFCLAAAGVFFGGGGRLVSLGLLAVGGVAQFLAHRIRTAASLTSLRPEVRP